MLIKVKVFPNSKKEEILKRKENSFYIFVKEEAKQKRANEKVFKILASYFKVSLSQIKLIKGGREKNKIFDIKN